MPDLPLPPVQRGSPPNHLSGKTISDILEMTVGEALEFFADHRLVAPILRAVVDIGLDYLRLGQPLTSFSGGECQRIKLAAHLHRQGRHAC